MTTLKSLLTDVSLFVVTKHLRIYLIAAWLSLVPKEIVHTSFEIPNRDICINNFKISLSSSRLIQFGPSSN